MAEFVSIDPHKWVQVNGQTILAISDGYSKSLKDYSDKQLEIFFGEKVLPEKWYSQDTWLQCFKHISILYPEYLYPIGRSIPKNAKFPPGVLDNMKNALSSIQMAYCMNHRRIKSKDFDPFDDKNYISGIESGIEEYIGYYKLLEIDYKKKSAVFECNNPYPSDFDKGIIECMAQKIEPNAVVNLKDGIFTKTRKKGGDKCKYLINW